MNNKIFRIIVAAGGGVILVLGIILVYLISDRFLEAEEAQLQNTESEIVPGEKENQETLNKIDLLFEEEPVLKKLPITVEYYSEDLSKYTKYIISYELDESEKGFHLVYKDYTGEGAEKISAKLAEMGMKLERLSATYEKLEYEYMNGHAE